MEAGAEVPRLVPACGGSSHSTTSATRTERANMWRTARLGLLGFVGLGLVRLVHVVCQVVQFVGGDAQSLGGLLANRRHHLAVQIVDQLRAFLLDALGSFRNCFADARAGFLHLAVEVVHGTPRNAAWFFSREMRMQSFLIISWPERGVNQKRISSKTWRKWLG